MAKLPLRAVVPPALSSEPSPASGIGLRPADVGLRGVKILLVDDDLDARESLAAVVEESGGEVLAVGSASEAFDVLPWFRPHVLVSDIGLPGEDGYSFIRRLRTLPPDRHGNVPAIALTAYTREEDRAKALAAGFTLHIGKPTDTIGLVYAIAELAERART